MAKVDAPTGTEKADAIMAANIVFLIKVFIVVYLPKGLLIDWRVQHGGTKPSVTVWNCLAR